MEGMLSHWVSTRVLAVLAAFGGLIFIHELGHFIVARLCGVRIEEFMLGIGPKLLSFRRGPTVYGIGWFPLGGYVRMAGQRDFQFDQGAKGAPDEYTSKSPGARALIIAAGVAMNVVLAFALLVVGYLAGIEFIPPVAGEVAEGSAAYLAGLREGDTILSVGGMEVTRWQDIARAVAFGKAERTGLVRVAFRHYSGEYAVKGEAAGGERIEADLPFVRDVDRGDLGLEGVDIPVVRLRLGMEVADRVRVRAVSPGSAAEEAGVVAGDVILEVNGEPLERYRVLNQTVREHSDEPVRLLLARGETRLSVAPVPRLVEDRPGRKIPRIGVELDIRPVVRSIVSSSPAARAGVAPGDSLASLKQLPGGRVEVRWERGSSAMGPAVLEQMPAGEVSPSIRVEGAILRTPQRKSPPGAVAAAARETVSLMADTFRVLCLIVTRRLGASGVSGPVAIVRLTYTATEPGFGYYLWFVALLSANLAVINMLPVPVLDGGHIVFILAEKLRGRPLPRRVLEYAQMAGLALLLALIVYVTFNDVYRWVASWAS